MSTSVRTFSSRFAAFARSGLVLIITGGGVSIGYIIWRKRKPASPKVDELKDYIYLGHASDGLEMEFSERQLKKSINYLKLAQSNHIKLSQYGLQSLAQLKKMEDYHCRRFSYLCDYKTAIQLARSEGVDLRLFTPPMNRYLRRGELFDILYEIHKAFPDSPCNSFFATMTFRTRDRLRIIESSLEDELKDKYLSRRGVNLLCLQALFRYSTMGEENCKFMVERGLISSLLTLFENFPEDSEMNASIAKILAQLSQFKFSRKHFFTCGWVGILARWLREENLELRLSANKALFNLSSDDQVLGNHLYILHPRFIDGIHKFDIVFIHGLLGSIFRTWRQADSSKERSDYTRCWPESWLANDISGLRILAVDYHSSIFERKGDCSSEKRSLIDRGETLINELIAAGVGKRPVIFVGHSMGGLLIKQILINSAQSSLPSHRNLLNQVKGIVFYSVPHKGSEFTRFPYNLQKIVVPSQEVRELIKDSPHLQRLHNQFSSVLKDKPIRILSYGEADKSKVGVKGIKVNTILVSPESADPGFGQFKILNTNHFNTCKPEDRSSSSYQDFKAFVRDVIQETYTLLPINPKELLEKFRAFQWS